MKKLIAFCTICALIFTLAACQKEPSVEPASPFSYDYVKAPQKEFTNEEREILDKAYDAIAERFSDFRKIQRDLLEESTSILSSDRGDVRISRFTFYYGGIRSGWQWICEENFQTGAVKVDRNEGLYRVPERFIGKKVSIAKMNAYKQDLISQIRQKVNEYGLKSEENEENYLTALYFMTQEDMVILSCEYIGYYDLPEDASERGCGIDHEHIFASVAIGSFVFDSD